MFSGLVLAEFWLLRRLLEQGGDGLHGGEVPLPPRQLQATMFQGWCWPGSSYYPDFLNKEARDYMAEQYRLENYKLPCFQGWCWPGSSYYPDFLNKEARDYMAEQYRLENYKAS